MKTLSLLVCGTCLLVVAASSSSAEVTKEDVPKLLKELKSGNPKTRIAAAEDLGHLGAIRASDALPALAHLLDMVKSDRDAGARKAAVAALGKMSADPEKAVPVLVDALKKDKAMPVKVAAASALGQLGTGAKDALPALREVQQGLDKNGKDKSTQALRRAIGEAMRSIRAQ